jgi:AcrR family transcriptional regulator
MEARRYEQTARAEAVRQRREAILKTAIDLFLSMPYDDVSLDLIATRAGVSLKTVTRQFGSKEELFLEAGRHEGPKEFARREAPPGDVRGAIANLANRYEALHVGTLCLLRIEDRLPGVATMLSEAREGHRGWLEHTFARWLPRAGAARQVRVAALFGATEIFLWNSYRVHLGMSRRAAEATMLEIVEALIERWEREGT